MKTKTRWLRFLGLTALVILMSSLMGNRVPLYDGIAFPDEPYRYVSPPDASRKTKLPPSQAQASARMSKGRNTSDITLTSQETGPQVTVYLVPQSIQASAQAAKITVRATPHAPDKNQPKKGPVVGNIYHFSASSDSGNTSLVGSSIYYGDVLLRLPQGYAAGATIVHRANASGSWASLVTTQTGKDVYQASLDGFGDYALISNNTRSKAAAPTKGMAHLALVLIAPIALILAIIVLIRVDAAKKKDGGK